MSLTFVSAKKWPCLMVWETFLSSLKGLLLTPSSPIHLPELTLWVGGLDFSRKGVDVWSCYIWWMNLYASIIPSLKWYSCISWPFQTSFSYFKVTLCLNMGLAFFLYNNPFLNYSLLYNHARNCYPATRSSNTEVSKREETSTWPGFGYRVLMSQKRTLGHIEVETKKIY
jgi:hypothetical protein